MKFSTIAVIAASALAASATYSNGTTSLPDVTTTVTYCQPTPSGPGGGTGVPNPPSNTTSILPTGSKTPVGPSGTGGPPTTNGVAANGASSALAVVGLAIAYFL